MYVYYCPYGYLYYRLYLYLCVESIFIYIIVYIYISRSFLAICLFFLRNYIHFSISRNCFSRYAIGRFDFFFNLSL